MAKRTKALIALFLLYGLFTLLLALLMGLVFSHDVDMKLPVGAFARYALPSAMLFLGVAATAAGIGLARQTAWGRPFAMLIALLSLILIPLGTIFGAFALWTLSSTGALQEGRFGGGTAPR